MIDIKNIEVVGLSHAIMSMRNPMNSWEESDSEFEDGLFTIGEKDLVLAMKLVKAGSDHSKFMRDIQVKCQISAPLYWWKEMDTYKVATVRNSCSTMHKILDHEFTLDDFAVNKINKGSYSYKSITDTIDTLNKLRTICIIINDSENACYKKAWYQIIQLLPSSYIQTSSWSGSYQTLRNIYFARNSHKLDEWHDFCHTIEALPHSELITCLSAKDELIEKLKTENEGLKNELKVVDYCRNDVITEPMNKFNSITDELESKDRKIKDLFDEKNVLNKRVDELEAENRELKKKLENANVVDEVLIDKRKVILDMLKTKPERILIFGMDRGSNFSFTPGLEIRNIKVSFDEYVLHTDTAPIGLNREDIKKILKCYR